MAEYYQLDYGQKVRILTGDLKDKEGIITMGSRFGDVGISFAENPSSGYDTRVRPADLEIICKEDPFGVKKKHEGGHDITIFQYAKELFAMDNPDYALQHPEEFDKLALHMAKSIVSLRDKPPVHARLV